MIINKSVGTEIHNHDDYQWEQSENWKLASLFPVVIASSYQKRAAVKYCSK